MKYDLHRIMKRAWELFRKMQISFSEALHRAWITAKAIDKNQQIITEAKAAAGIEEETNTWNAWKQAGFKVIHGSKALFNAILIWGSHGDGATYRAAFFGKSQVQPITE